MPRIMHATTVDNAMDYQTLTIETRQTHVLLATLNRPKALNALNTQMGRELYELWTRLAAEPGETRCVVLTLSLIHI